MTTDSAWVEGSNAYFFGARAQLVSSDTEVAWAEKHIVHNAAHAWIIGKYVEADRANSNGQYFELNGLRMAQPTIAHSPMNINHEGQAVGAFVATDLVYPTEGAAEGANPYIEALGVVWKAHFPDAFSKIQKAHSEGNLYFSMECVPKQISCIGENGCGNTYEYAGIMSPTYCSHINDRSSDRELVEPHFTAGAIIIPPVRPGWSSADVHSLVANHVAENERIMAEVAAKEILDQGNVSTETLLEDPAVVDWNNSMSALMELDEYSKSFTAEERDALAKSGKALGDGSYPIVNVADLKNAIQAVGRAKDSQAAKAHIRKRAKALGATDLLPEDWSN